MFPSHVARPVRAAGPAVRGLRGTLRCTLRSPDRKTVGAAALGLGVAGIVVLVALGVLSQVDWKAVREHVEGAWEEPERLWAHVGGVLLGVSGVDGADGWMEAIETPGASAVVRGAWRAGVEMLLGNLVVWAFVGERDWLRRVAYAEGFLTLVKDVGIVPMVEWALRGAGGQALLLIRARGTLWEVVERFGQAVNAKPQAASWPFAGPPADRRPPFHLSRRDGRGGRGRRNRPGSDHFEGVCRALTS